jgi:multidrug efflux system membrane fusion protein
MDERTLLMIRTAVNQGRIKKVSNIGDIPLLMGLPNETDYPHKGKLNFVNNIVNPSTGTILVRGAFDNSAPAGGVRLLAPGMFVRVRLPIGTPYKALLVIDRALGSDQGLKYVYIVTNDNKVQQRRVQTGALQEDGLRVITGGLKAEDRVVVGAIQQVQQGMQIEPEMVTMPTLTAPAQVKDKENK